MPETSLGSYGNRSEAQSAPRLRWTVWPLVDRPLVSLGVVALMAALGWGVAVGSGGWYWGVLAAMALALSLWRYLLPVTFDVGIRGLRQDSLLQQARTSWSDIRAVRRCRGGLLMLPGTDDRPLDAMRGLFVPWGPHRAELLQLVALYLTGGELED
ncbi:MAG: hypothetical protein DWQ35_14180 [Planctomycetota bacterium]|nr:MAG: hypothetical protein DWQ35_14180 [Planctomycetota bacterium]REK26963.1 MAG: hypothetical protein DWQ42_07845 [Planctomycetota bacterium]REK44319.1 MAG: hypothetical protein DWQ46_10145 [Planctomycetota bacterium]